MTREDIIRMARNVCDTADPILEDGSDLAVFRLDELDRFAALIAAAERENIAAWVEDMCEGLDAKTIANGIRNGGNDDIRAFEVRK